MVERVSVNLKGPLDYDSEAEERPASPPPDSETLYALIFNVSFTFFENKNFNTKYSIPGCKSLCGQGYFQ